MQPAAWLTRRSAGDLTEGAASTGGVLRRCVPAPACSCSALTRRAAPPACSSDGTEAGALLSVDADAGGRAHLVVPLASQLQVWDIIGRALVISGSAAAPAVAAVLARSAVAGDNTKKVCACDGTLIWASGDLIPRKE